MRLETRACLDNLIRASELIELAMLGLTVEDYLMNW